MKRNSCRRAGARQMFLLVLVMAGVLGHSAGCARPSSDSSEAEKSRRPFSFERTWTDPRRDPESLRWAVDQLTGAEWRGGYSRLIERAAGSDRMGRSTARFVRITPPKDQYPTAEVRALIADLLGSTLVDAQDELWAAFAAIERNPDRARAMEWLVEPPPWPPASVNKYLSREGEHGMALVETLAAELAPEAPARAWLIRSWLGPARFVDHALLAELCEAAEGRLCREVRFRAWLREEWTVWARQRYRRVARWAGSHAGGSLAERTSSPR